MKNFYKTSFILFIILILLASIIFFINKNEKSYYIFNNINDIKEIHFISTQKKLIIKKIYNQWKIIYPFNDLINMDNLNNLLNNIKKINIKNSFSSENLNDFGLTNPLYSLIIFSKNKKNILKIGNKLSYDDKYYCLFNNKIFLINSSLFNLIKNPVSSFRNKHIFNYNKNNINKILFEDNNENFSLLKNKNIWKLFYKNKPFNTDKEKIDLFLDDLLFIKCDDFSDSKINKLYDKKITLFENNKKLNFNFYSLKNSSFLVEVESRNVLMQLNDFPIKRIFKKYQYFINKKLLNFQPENVKKIIFTFDNKKYTLIFKNNNWLLNNKKINFSDQLSSFLFLSSSLNGDKLYNKNLTTSPIIEISFFFTNNKFQHIKIFNSQKNNLYASSNINTNLFFTISNDYYSEILKIKKFLKK